MTITTTDPSQPRQPQLRGTCERAARALVAKDPTLTLVRGWYVDAIWGYQEHWWCETGDGAIVDPTVEQFPTGHIPALRSSRPYGGVYPCGGCGGSIRDGEDEDGFCCGACYGSVVGIWIGACECR